MEPHLVALFALLSGCTPSPPRGEESGSATTPAVAAETDTGDTGEHGTTSPPAPAACDPLPPLTGFVTREGDALVLDGAPFRFVSVNLPDLIGIVDPEWQLPTPWEQRDGLCAVRQLGGQVARTYSLGVGGSSTDAPRHVVAPGVLDEEAMGVVDAALAAANEQGVRLVVPLIDQWSWIGGIAEHAAFRGKSADEFWTDEAVIADFEATIDAVIGRTNTITGVPYAEDPALLAWETGNELDAPREWTRRIAAHIKDLDPNHLVIDGTYGIVPGALEDPNVDVVSDHYYWPRPYGEDYAAAAHADHLRAEGARPFMIGEYGFVPTDRIEALLEQVETDGIAGALLWSLRFHAESGGFYWHTEIDDDVRTFKSYHWPGFASGDEWDERAVLELLAEYAAAASGVEPELLPPEAPVVLDASVDGTLHWRGSTGAASYVLERAPDSAGPWTRVADGFDDAQQPLDASVIDESWKKGTSAWFRMLAVGAGGESVPSEPFGPITRGRVWIDELDDLSHVAAADASLSIDTTNVEYFEGDTGRLFRSAPGNASATWDAGGALVAAAVDAWMWPTEPTRTVELEASPNGAVWSELDTTETDHGGDWGHVVIEATSFPAGSRYLRLTIVGHEGQTWNPQVGRVTLVTD
jgi:hypothetical protein